MDETFGQLLAAARIARKWTFTQLAKKAKYTDTHIRSMEIGARSPPAADQVRSLCDVLGVNAVPMLRASIRRRGCVELSVTDAQVNVAAQLARAWPMLDADDLARLDRLLAEALR